MKPGWEVKRLEDVAEIYQPKTISAKDLVEDGEYPVFGANGVIGRYSEFNHAEPQLTITCRGATCGTVNITPANSWITGNAMVVRPKIEGLTTSFAEYFFRGGLDFAEIITGAAQPQITRKSLAPVEIPIPPLDEQKRIVEVLDAAFAGLARAKENTQTNLQNARELFNSFTQQVMTVPQAESHTVALGDVCSIVSKLVDPKLQAFENLKHLGAGNMISESDRLIDVQTAKDEGLTSGKHTFSKGDILYSKIRPYLKKVARPAYSGLCSADVYPLTPNDQIESDFLYHLLLSPDFTHYAVTGSGRAGMPKVNRKHLFDYEFSLPKLSRQKQIANAIDGLWILVSQLEDTAQSKLQDIEDLRQSLLQKAFAGELT